MQPVDSRPGQGEAGNSSTGPTSRTRPQHVSSAGHSWPTPAPAGRVSTVYAWLNTQMDGLVPTSRRVALDASMADLCAEHSRWACWWFAGVISDHMRALPGDDPWRHLSAGAGVGRSRMTRGTWPDEGTVGAAGPRGRFGSPDDGMDVALDAGLPASMDPELAALADGLPDHSAAVLAFAADGWRQAGLAAIAVVGADRHATFPLLSRALAWAMWRRRWYLPGSDPLTIPSGQAWGWRADELAAGRDLDGGEQDRIDQAVREATPTLTWHELTAGEA